MRIGLLTSDDYANFQYDIYRSLQSVGVDVIARKIARHIFSYDNQCEVITPNNIKETYKDCDIVIITHSCWQLMELLDNKLIIPFHTGTPYRSNPELVNSKFNAPISLIALPEFQTLAPNPKYLVGAIESDWAVKDIVGRRIRVGHFPSNPDVKGTNEIIRIISGMDCEFIYSTERVSHTENLKRIYDCDIYVELLASTQGGKPYGSFGITALEAAAMGKIVITQAINDNGLYENVYGINMLNFVKDELGLKKTLSSLLQYKGDYLIGQMELTKEWMEKNHSYKATGTKLISYLNGL